MGAGRLVANIREGRMQKLLAARPRSACPPLAFEIYLEHYKGSFGDKWMWTPIVLTPPLTAAGVAGFYSERRRDVAAGLSARSTRSTALIGVVTHLRGVQKRPGGFGEPTYNLVMGPPLLAPGSLASSARSGCSRRSSSASDALDFGEPHHLPKPRRARSDDLPRQRRGITPQMHGRYPDYDVLERGRPLGRGDAPRRPRPRRRTSRSSASSTRRESRR